MIRAEFEPRRIVVEPGQTVTWWNAEELRHTVTAYERRIPDEAAYFTSGGFDSEADAEWDWYTDRDGDVLPEDPFVHTFETVGEHSSYCFLHETNMRGR